MENGIITWSEDRDALLIILLPTKGKKVKEKKIPRNLQREKEIRRNPRKEIPEEILDTQKNLIPKQLLHQSLRYT